MLIFCRFLMVDLAHFRGLQRSLGALGNRPGSSWERMLAFGSSQGCTCARVHDIGGSKGGPGDPICRPQGQVDDGKVVNNA